MNSNFIDILRKSFNSNKTKSLSFRLSQLQGLINFVKENEIIIVEALGKDLGKPRNDALVSELLPIEMETKYVMENLANWMKPEYTQVPFVMEPATSEIQSEPYGVCLVMGAFNFPFSLLLSPLIGAIAAGNCAVIKPSEMTPSSEAVLLAHLGRYLDPECYHVVTGGVEVTSELLKIKFDKIFFTGSARVGRIVMRAAAEHLTPVTLELGGKSPTIVDESAQDLDLVARRIIWGKAVNAGQICIAPDYVFCHEKHHDKLVQIMKEVLKKQYGENRQKCPDFGRIVSKGHCQRLEKLLESARSNKNFTIECGGSVDVSDRFVDVTLVTGVDGSCDLMKEEIFGPILPILKYHDLSEPIFHIKSGDKPLVMYIFGKSNKNIDRLIHEVSSGGVVVNDTLFHFGNQYAPFGGVGSSGIGEYHGKFSFDGFSHKRQVMRRDDHGLLDMPHRYAPYSDFNLSVFLFAARLPALPFKKSKYALRKALFAMIGISIVSIGVIQYAPNKLGDFGRIIKNLTDYFK
eukprot:gene14931-20084_t